MPSSKEPRFLFFVHRFLDRGSAAHILALIVLGFCAYFNAIFHPFVHDDVVFILQNPNIARWDNIGDAFLRPSIPQFFQGLVTPYYRPVLEVLYRGQYALFGPNAHGFHFFNVLVHIINGILVYVLAQKIIKSRASAFVMAAVFLVHPVQTQAVACVSGISNLACAFFILAAFYSYVRSTELVGSNRIIWFFAAWLGFIVALFTKEQAVVFPIICMLYELLVKEKGRLASGISRVVFIAAPLLGYLIVRQSLFGGFTSAIFENIGELKLRLLAIPGTIDMYAGILFFPSGLHYYRSIDILAPYVCAWILFISIAVLICVALRPLAARERKLALFGLAWFVLSLGPVLNIIPLVNEYSFVAAAEHNLYFSLIGSLFFACAVLRYYASVLNPSVKYWAGIFLIVGIICLSVLTFRQNYFWKGEIPLFQRAAQFEPRLGRVHILLAKAYFKEGRINEAIREFDLARDIMNGYAQKAATPKAKRFYEGMLKGIYSDSAQGYAFKRDFRSSLRQYDMALGLDPRDSYIYSNRALSLIGMGDLDGGIKDLKKALTLNSDNLLAANNLGICYIQQGNMARAREVLSAILIKDPNFAAARDNLNKLNKAQISRP